MVKKLDEILIMCMDCKSIKLDNSSEIWFKEEADKELYKKYIEKNKGKISHSICDDCMKERYGDIDNSFNNKK